VRLRRPSFRRSALLLAALAALHGLVYIPLVDTNEKTDTWSYVASANAILDGGYSTPLQAGFYYVYPVGWFDITGARIAQSAWDEPERQVFRPPGYPAYLALFGKDKVIGGEHTAALLGQALLFGLGAYLLILTVRRCWGENVALLGGLLYAVDPWSKHYVALVLSETVAGTVAIALVYAFTRAWEQATWPRWLAAGALAGVLSLVRAVFVIAPALLVLAALVRRGTPRERLTRAAATAVASAVLIVPWLAWTHSVVGRATMSAWGEGYNFVLAASGEGHGTTAGDVEAEPAFQARMDRIRAQVPSAEEIAADPTAHPRYLLRADEQVRDDAFELLRERLADEPLDVLWDGVYRMWFLWNAHEDWYQPSGAALLPFRALDAVLVVLALVGAAIAVARGGAGRAVVAFLAAYTLVLGTHHVEARFAMPVRGVFLSLVALALAAAWRQRSA
jgi:hypothetical protein